MMMQESWREYCKKKYIAKEHLKEVVAQLKEEGKTIVTTNGSFDLLHAGHLHTLFEASKLGDILIVAVNSDQSIKQYKSIHRPIIPLQYRLEMIAALQFVTFTTSFDEVDPRKLLSIIKPDVHVNAAEYGKNCIEAETIDANGGKLILIDTIDGLSSSQIINTILRNHETHLDN